MRYAEITINQHKLRNRRKYRAVHVLMMPNHITIQDNDKVIQVKVLWRGYHRAMEGL
jgi:hypothetical protein